MGSPTDDVTLLDEQRPRASAVEGTSPPVILAGRYEMLGLLGVGGMGAVYRVLDRELDETVALKMLRRELIDMPGILERFRTEVKAARKVTSPFVARTFDIGEHDGDKFLTMELVDGGSLAAEMERSATGMPIPTAVGFAALVCRGLAAAHAVGVVHRDLKPDNVLLGRDGSVKITDFGIAKVEANARMTHGSVGTPAYMAPEQVTGERDLDARADLYALGAMLYEMLTGQLPWNGDSVFAIASARLIGPPPDVRALRPEVPLPLAELVTALMARRKEERPASAVDVLSALAGIGPPQENDEPPPTSMRAPRASTARSTVVAVLPFVNRGAPDDAYVAEAVTDDIIDALSMSRGLRVFARGAVAPFAGATRDPRDAGRKLGAHVVVHGTLERAGDTFRIHARLSSVGDGLQLWAERLSPSLADLLSAAGEIGRRVAATLAVDSGNRPEVPRDPVTIELYLRARRSYYGYGSGADNRIESVDLFRRALERAPGDPALLAGYAIASLVRSRTQSDLETAVRMAEEAVAAAPQVAEARYALGNVRLNQGRFVDAARELRAALDIAPSSADAHYGMGILLGEGARFEESRRHLEIAGLIDPTMLLATLERARIAALSGEHERGIEILESIPAKDASPLYWMSRIRLAHWRYDEGEVRALIAAARASAASSNNIVATMTHAVETGEWPRDALNATLRRLCYAHIITAEIAGARGDDATAIEHIEAASRSKLTDVAWMDRCPAIARVRGDARVRAARTEVALRAVEMLAALDGAA